MDNERGVQSGGWNASRTVTEGEKCEKRISGY